jgi:transcription elongation factor GreA
MNKQIQITSEGMDSLKLELDELVTKKRPVLVERLERARSDGDLAENSDYASAKEELEFLDGRIDELKHVLDNAEVIKVERRDGEVAVGARVTVKCDGSERVFHIVGEWEADPLKQKISYDSPLGQALNGKKVGEKVEVEAPVGKVVYEIISVE